MAHKFLSYASYGDIKEIFAGYGGFVTFVKSNAKALSTAVPSIKSTLAPSGGARRPVDVCSAPTEAERRPILFLPLIGWLLRYSLD